MSSSQYLSCIDWNTSHPERLRGLIVQDAVAHNEGRGSELGDTQSILGGASADCRALAGSG
jgi:hypothetical protein